MTEDLLSVPKVESSSNVGGQQPFGVNVTYPEVITIRMVDASALGDYEFSILLAGLFCNVSVGFLVAAMTIKEDIILMWILSAIFAVVTIVFAGWASIKRKSMNQRAKVVKLVSSSIE